MSEQIATRYAYGEALKEIGNNPLIIAFDADVSTCTMSCIFGKEYPERFYNVGIAEANMLGMAAGMATAGYIPFVHAFAMFCAGRGYEQIRNSIAYPNLNVKIVGTHAGLSVGEDGATHQCLEDLALMRVIPNMTVICPSDGNETRNAVKAIVEYKGPVYLRLGRMSVDTVTDFPSYKFEIGKGVLLKEGTEAVIIATGCMVQESLKAAELLERQGISVRVIDIHTIKPIDREMILKAAKETGAVVTAEEHHVAGGLGGAVAELLGEEYPIPVVRVGTYDQFGRSGEAGKLMDMYGLSKDAIIEAVKKAICMKG